MRLLDSRGTVAVEDGVDLGVPLELEVLAELLADGGLDSLQDVGEDTEVGRVVVVVVLALEDTGAHQTGVPAVHVTTADVGGRVVTDHVDVLGQAVLVVDLLHPGLHDLIGVGVSGALGLAVDDTLQVDTGEGLVLSLNGDTEETLGQTGGTLVVGREDQVTLGEVDRDAGGNGVLGAGQQLSVLSQEEIHDELHVSGVVAGVGEHQDSIELDLREVAGLGLETVLLVEAAPGGDGLVPGEDILGMDDVLEAVVLSDLADLLALTTADQDGFVVLGQRLHWGVRLDELVGGDGAAKDLGELGAALILSLTTTVGQENVRDLDAQLVVTVEHGEGLLGLGNGLVTVGQDTIDIESEGHVLGSSNLLLGHVLDLRGQDVAGNIRSDHRGKTGDTGRSGDGQGSAEGVAGTTTVPGGGSKAQVVHVLSSIADGAASSGDLNGVASIVRDGQRASSATTSIPGEAGTRGRGSVHGKVGVVKARHDEFLGRD